MSIAVLYKRKYQFSFYRTILFLASSGKAVYPKYEVSRKMIIFQEREDLILCISVYEDFCQLQIFCEKKRFEEAEKIYLKVHRQFKEAMENLAKGDPRLSYVRFDF